MLPPQTESPPRPGTDATTTDRLPALTQLVGWQAALMSQDTLGPAGIQLVSDLAASLGCTQVALGWWQRQHSRLLAVSAPTALGDEAGALRTARAFEAAMDECLDQDVLVRFPEPADAPPRITLAHAALVQPPGGDPVAVASLPLHAHGRAVGALTLCWSNPQALARFDPDTLRHQLALMVPWLDLLHRHEQPLWQRAAQGGRRRWRRSSWLRGGGGAGLAVLVAGWLLWPVAHELGGRARLDGQQERSLTAPTDGFLQAVHARPGDRVRAGQPLLELAPQDLEVDVHRLESEIAQHQNAYMAALARSDRAQMGLHLARSDEVGAQLQLVRRELGRTRIAAPMDALVLDGDLTRSVGMPVRRGDTLMRLTPDHAPRVVVEIDERDIDAVRPGQPARLALSALPWDTLDLQVERVQPVAHAVEGANVFEVEARLQPGDAAAAQASSLRPGLTGVARIEVGRQSRLVTLGTRAADWLRLQWWRWNG
ncbi:efflux RND transporter periplasmic adaptor subunit [Sphaerotilus sp.]|uniref:efflux RND transporter periplasmic adaptor subunit n=1 Tax=Sphaerotilus sp. TaxID=2093942 RepID=UPI0025E5E0B5|nr:HlyD family efflux transporter periplasmic adaptor subunit [Sphaerotilus sp.]